MPAKPRSFRKSLVAKLLLAVGMTLVVGISAWSHFSIAYQRQSMLDQFIAAEDRLSTTIKLGTHYAMMLNSRQDIAEIIRNTSRQKEIESIRIYTKEGRISFSNRDGEVDSTDGIWDGACQVCHHTEPPLATLGLRERTRIISGPDGQRRLGIMSPIYNEPGCSPGPCHVHPEGKQVLGLLDVVVSMEEPDSKMAMFQRRTVASAFFVFLASACIIFVFVHTVVTKPVHKLIEGTKRIARGSGFTRVDVEQEDELGELAHAINQMGRDIFDKQTALNEQRDEYQNLFEGVPCIITVQDRDYRMLRYNRQFRDRFHPLPGDHCYRAYKGFDHKCANCPVERTFADGRSHVSEESAVQPDGTVQHWLVTTSPIRNAQGEVVAAMEMSLDITPRKQLEQQLAVSEKKYHAIFSNIPNAVLVLDEQSLDILDGNERAMLLYGVPHDQLRGMAFPDFFHEEDRQDAALRLRRGDGLDQVRQVAADGRRFYVSLTVSPSEYSGRRVLLASATDITRRLEAEQQLIQASKMATLGEMSTGVAHELNQPLSVIQTISSYLMRKLRRNEVIDAAAFQEMAEGINANVERAAKIINHMREFGRKSDLKTTPVDVNGVLEKAMEIFREQLKLRNIDVEWRLAPDLPAIQAEPNRLEQVCINLFLNARDAIEEKWAGWPAPEGDRKIEIATSRLRGQVVIEVSDTGAGIPKAIAEKLFEPFFTTKEVGKGTGLGLSISYGIVKDYGGTITALTRQGGGARFVITFPVPDDQDSRSM
ncbi:MAG: PAS domain S-box protein [Desulfovibrionaceae bacterium]